MPQFNIIYFMNQIISKKKKKVIKFMNSYKTFEMKLKIRTIILKIFSVKSLFKILITILFAFIIRNVAIYFQLSIINSPYWLSTKIFTITITTIALGKQIISVFIDESNLSNKTPYFIQRIVDKLCKLDEKQLSIKNLDKKQLFFGENLESKFIDYLEIMSDKLERWGSKQPITMIGFEDKQILKKVITRKI